MAEGRAGGPQGNPLTPGGLAETYLCTYVSHQGTRTPRTRSNRKTSPENLGARKSEFRRRVEASCPSSFLSIVWTPRKARNRLQLEPCCDQVDASPVPRRGVRVAKVACVDFQCLLRPSSKIPESFCTAKNRVWSMSADATSNPFEERSWDRFGWFWTFFWVPGGGKLAC